MSNYLLTTDGSTVRSVERKLQAYLPGLDARLVQVDTHRALLRQHLVHALEQAYPEEGAAGILRAIGVAAAVPASDEATMTLTEVRAVEALDDRKGADPPPDAVHPEFDWHLAMLRVPQAWALLGGPEHIVWDDVVVGHIDTGFVPHPVFGFPDAPWVRTDLARTFVPPPPSNEATLFPDEPGAGVDNRIGMFAGHGTRTASAICGCAPAEDGRMFYGAAPKVPLVPVRISGSVWINDRQDEFAQAVDHLLAVPGMGVISVSLGVHAAFLRSTLRKALDRAYDAGVIVVCAAGNYVSAVVAPARLNRTLAIGGVTWESRPWSGSCYGPQVDVSAPAADLRRASITSTGKPVFAGKGDGTSYATAATAGVVALWLADRRDELQQRYVEPWQRVEAFRHAVCASARRPAHWQDGAFGVGVVDAHALLTWPLPEAAALVRADPA